MPSSLSRGDCESQVGPAKSSAQQIGWPRVLLFVALLSLPLFFQGCQSQKLQFTLGPAIPFAEIESNDQPAWIPATLISWSWTTFLANIAILALAVWLATRFAWLSRVAATHWFP